MKKFISIFVLTAILLQSVLVFASDTQPVYDGFEALGNKLVAVGAISEVYGQADDLVTRGEFAQKTAELFNLNTSSGEQIYYDVDSSDSAYGAVYALYKSGAVSLSEDKRFNPNANITGAEAAKIIVTMLGYGEKAKAHGGYPSGYLYVASGLKISFEEYRGGISYMGMLQAFESIAEVNIPVMESIKEGYVSYETSADVTVLSEYHDVYCYEGVVEAVGVNSIYGNENLTSDKASIGGVVYYSEYDLQDFIGCNVTYYYRDDSTKKTVVYAELVDENSVFDIDGRDIADYKNNVYTYYRENGKTDSVKVSAVPFVLYNGKTATGKNKNMYTPENGSVRLVDSDSDRVYDVIIIKDYKTVVVEAIDTQNSVVYGKGGVDDTIVFGEENDVDSKITTSNGKDIFMGVIGEWNVISALVSEDEKYVRAVVNTSSVSGRVEAVADDTDGVTITIDGADYEVLSSVEIPPVGTNVVCYFDFEGRIAAVSNKENTEYEYYVLMDCMLRPGMESETMIQIKGADNEVREYTLTENAKIDGTRMKTAAEQLAAIEKGLESGCIVRIKMTDGIIEDIDTPFVSSKESADSTISLYMEKTDQLLYKTTGNVEDKFYLTDSTFVVFEYPGLTDEERYLITNRKMLTNDTRHTVTAYAIGETYTPQVAVFEFSNSSGIVSTDSVYVVSDIRKAEDPTGNMENKLELMGYSSNTELYVDDQTIKDLGGIDVGDIIRFDPYKNNYVLSDFIRKVYDYSEDKVVDKTLADAKTTSSAVRLGYAYNKIDSYLSYAAVDDIADIEDAEKAVTVLPSNIIRISKERDKVVVGNGSVSDIRGYKTFDSSCSRIFIKFRYRVPYECVIIER